MPTTAQDPSGATPPLAAPTVVLLSKPLQYQLRDFRRYHPLPAGHIVSLGVCTRRASSITGPAATAHPVCSTGQVVMNPSFYILPPLYAADVAH